MRVSVYKHLRSSTFHALPTNAALGATLDYIVAPRTLATLFCDSLLVDLSLPIAHHHKPSQATTSHHKPCLAT
jgi:hypothetical protein